MSVAGGWNRSEITASYTPSQISCWVTIVATVAVITFVGKYLGRRIPTIAMSVVNALVFGTAFFFLTRYFAASLSIDAPLHIKVPGFYRLPFWLATTEAGLAVLAVLFVATNFLVMFVRVDESRRSVLLFALNLALAGILAGAVIGVTFATNAGLPYLPTLNPVLTPPLFPVALPAHQPVP